MPKKTKKIHSKSAFFILLAAFIVLTSIVSVGALAEFEEDLLLYIYGASDNLWPFALAVTQLGSAWFMLSLVGLMFVIKWKPDGAMSVLLNCSVAAALNYLLKLLVSRPRPPFILDDILSREIFTFGYGYPSGHTALAAAAAFALLPYLPGKTKWLVVPWVLLVGWSRMYLGVHAPFDIIGGILVAAIVVVGLPLLPENRLSKYLKT